MKKVLLTLLSLAFFLPSNSTWAALTQTEISQLYIGVFGRASEGGGNSYWQTDPQSTSMIATANVMLNTAPAKAYFGTTLSNNQDFIEHIYLNTLGKTYGEDPTGINYWVSELDGGKTKGEVIAALVVAAQHPLNAGAAQDRFNNKVEVSNYCADNIPDYTDLATFTGFLSSVTDTVDSVTSAKLLIDIEKKASFCDNKHLDLCISMTECTGAGGGWYNNLCNEQLQEIIGDYTNSFGMSFNLIPAGTFLMGSPEDEPSRYLDEVQHQVTLTKNFYMQTTEVSQGQWQAVMGSNPSYFTSCGSNCPVENVSWADVSNFIIALNARTGETYRLPTEAEWEYAARAGNTTSLANGGILSSTSLDANLDAVGWYSENSNRSTHSVAQKQPNAWGLYDMHGNVFEWVEDWYQKDLGTGAMSDPRGPDLSSIWATFVNWDMTTKFEPEIPTRVFRGGNWSEDAGYFRFASRPSTLPTTTGSFWGFRLLLSSTPHTFGDDGECTDEYVPVCGVDGTTYTNPCNANAAEIEIDYEGECALCDSNNIDICKTSSTCTGANGYWWSNNTCRSTIEPVSVVGTVVSNTGRVWMDRNLGASRVATSATDSLAYGDMYQWGRGTDGHEKVGSGMISDNNDLSDPGHGYFIAPIDSHESNWLQPDNNDLWQGVKGGNNPCPEGFRIPTKTEFEMEMNSWFDTTMAGAYGSPLKFVAAGVRIIINNNHGYGRALSIEENGSRGYYWSSTQSTFQGEANSLVIQSNGSQVNDLAGAMKWGMSIRCIEDGN